MRSPLARGAIALVAIAAVVVLFVVLSGDDDGGGNGGEQATTTQTEPAQSTTGATGTTGAETPAPRPAVPRIVVRDGRPRGGVRELSFQSGERIVFRVQSDSADEVHVHGYDITQPVAAGALVRLSFPARLEGVFEVELHDAGTQIAELRVSP